MRTLLTNATLIDCVHPTPRPQVTVAIGDDGRITDIIPAGQPIDAGDAQVIDLERAYLLPGLWDVHIHPDYLTLADMPLADQVALFGHRLMSSLTESGIIGFRCAGTHSFMDVAWKRAFDSGQFVGPRLYACGHFLTTTGGHFLTSGHALECDGPYGFVQRVRAHHDQVGEFTDFNCAQIIARTAHCRAMFRRREQGLPWRGTILHPQPHFQQPGILQRANVRAQRQLHASVECLAKPGRMHVARRVSATAQ